MPKAKKTTEANFEQDMAALEAIVTALEEGGLPLDESLKQFEQGSALVRRCEKALAQAEQRIEILMKNASGEFEAQPFDDEEPEEEAGEEKAPPKPKPARAAKTAATTPQDEDPPIPEEPPEEEDDLLF